MSTLLTEYEGRTPRFPLGLIEESGASAGRRRQRRTLIGLTTVWTPSTPRWFSVFDKEDSAKLVPS